MPSLNGGLQPVPLAPGYSIRAPGLRGSAELLRPKPAGTRGPDLATPDLDAALARADMTERAVVTMDATPERDVEVATRAPDGSPAFELTTPDFGADNGQVVMEVNEAGAVTWHFPLATDNEVEPASTRSADGTKRYRIPNLRPPTPTDADVTQRGLIGSIGRKILKVLVFPITDRVVGVLATQIAEKMEREKHPYGVRTMTPENYGDPAPPMMSSGDWQRLQAGRALFWVHGTFSSADGAFNALPKREMKLLDAMYGSRMFAFNHYTLSHSPKRNIEELMKLVPAGVELDVDIICHSRGGLVARTLADGYDRFGVNSDRIRVHRVILVAVPNAGTALAAPDHMVNMLDRYTTALNLIPAGPIADVLDSILIAVKVIAHGALDGLEGLASMNPDGAYVEQLNCPPQSTTQYFAIAANYEPKDEGLKSVLAAGADHVIDGVFEDKENDLVVPEAGVYSGNGNPCFPVPDSRVMRIPATEGVMHTTIFQYPAIGEKIRSWLADAADTTEAHA